MAQADLAGTGQSGAQPWRFSLTPKGNFHQHEVQGNQAGIHMVVVGKHFPFLLIVV